VVKQREAAGALVRLIVGTGLVLGAVAVSGCSSEQDTLSNDPKAQELHKTRLNRGMFDDAGTTKAPQGRTKSRTVKRVK